MSRTSRQGGILDLRSNLSALVSCGRYLLSDAECGLQDEINWLSINKTAEIENYRAVICSQHDNTDVSGSDPPVVIAEVFSKEPLEALQEDPAFAFKLNSLSNATVFLAGSLIKTDDFDLFEHTPYTYFDRDRNLHYTMLMDCEPDVADLFFHLPGFVDWLGKHRPELLFNRDARPSEYLFYWLIMNILEPGTELPDGLYRGLAIISDHNLGGLFNLLFTDGTGVYAFSGKAGFVPGNKTIAFRINRDEHNIYSYVLRNTEDHQDVDWIHLKANSLYYFPTHGTLQIFPHFNPQQQSESAQKHSLNSSYLSNLSIRSLMKGITSLLDTFSSGWIIYY